MVAQTHKRSPDGWHNPRFWQAHFHNNNPISHPRGGVTAFAIDVVTPPATELVAVRPKTREVVVRALQNKGIAGS